MTTIDDLVSGFSDEPGYFDFAKWGPISRPVADEERALVDVQSRARFGSEVALTEQAGRVRRAISSVVGFPTDQVVFQPHTSAGLLHTMFGLTGQVLMSPATTRACRWPRPARRPRCGSSSRSGWISTTTSSRPPWCSATSPIA
nr:hypothetical protein GCM10025699_61080 [Microbacterium flavescens]